MSSACGSARSGCKTMFVRIPADAGQPRGRRQPRPFPRRPRRRGAPEGALDRRHRACRVGPARLARRARRALDADARPPRAARRLAAGRRLCSRLLLWLQIALAAALGAPIAFDRLAAARAPAGAQRLAARLAAADARSASPPRPMAGARDCARSRGSSSPTSSPSSPRAARWRSTRRAGRSAGTRRAISFPRRRRPRHEPVRSASSRLRSAGWVGVRALSLGLIPGGEALAFDRAATPCTAPRLPPVAATEFAPLEPVAPPRLRQPSRPAYAPRPASLSGALRRPGRLRRGRVARPAVLRHAASPPLAAHGARRGRGVQPRPGRGALCRMPRSARPMAARRDRQRPRRRAAPRRAQSTPAELIRAIPGIDRLSMSALGDDARATRARRRSPPTASLAAARPGRAAVALRPRASPRASARARRSAGSSAAPNSPPGCAGSRSRSIPVALTAERRQSFGPDKGRSAFALFAEGGVYDRPIVAGFNLDAYLQAGVVGVRDRAAFVDGSATLTRPVWRQFSAGFGVWGGAQPGLARLDAGPRAELCASAARCASTSTIASASSARPRRGRARC